MRRNFTPYMFYADVYKEESFFDESGQEVKTWVKDRTIKVHYMPSRGEERLVGRIQNPRSYLIWTDDIAITHDDQIRDLRDSAGNIIEANPMNVISVKLFPRLGKVRHAELNCQVVLS